MHLAQPTVGQNTLEETPERLLKFLLALSRYPYLMRRLRTRGYDIQRHKHGYALLTQLGEVSAPPDEGIGSPEVKHALMTLNQNDEDALRLARSALRYRFPLQAEFVLQGLTASRTDAEAAAGMRLLIERIEQLREGTGPEETREHGQAAVAELSVKGLNEPWLSYHKGLCDTLRFIPEDAPTDAEVKTELAEYQTSLLALRAFWEEWSDVARVEFKTRREMIRLGLAQRRVGEDIEAEHESGAEHESEGAPMESDVQELVPPLRVPG